MDERQIRELVPRLNEASRQYYSCGQSDMSDQEYDKLYLRLVELEKITGFVLPESPTNNVGYFDIEKKVRHDFHLTSLKSTKDVQVLERWQDGLELVLSHKLDGLTLVLTYNHGTLVRAISRGDGDVGVDVTRQATRVDGILVGVEYDGYLTVLGEVCCSYRNFETIKNSSDGSHYANPRNMAAGAIMSPKTQRRVLEKLSFVVWDIRYPLDEQSPPWEMQYEDGLIFAENLGFKTVYRQRVCPPSFIGRAISDMSDELETSVIFPCDGLVARLNHTSEEELYDFSNRKYPKYAIAFKWPDQIYTTRVTGMEWSVSNTGAVTPIVCYEPVEIEGTLCSKANLHSLKVFEELQIGKNDILEVFKSNKIIPTVASNLTRSGTEKIPKLCPRCGGFLRIVEGVASYKLQCDSCNKHVV